MKMKVETENDIEVSLGNGPTKYGPGVDITMSRNDLAKAIFLYLESQGVYISGPRTASYNGELCNDSCKVYVDPSGFVVANGKKFTGRGKVI